MMTRFSLKKLRQIFLCLVLVISFGYGLPVFADATPPTTPPATVAVPKVCDCWCTSAEGAKKLDKKISMDDCRASCTKSGQRMSVCSYTLKDTPNNITWCFAKDFCEKQNGKLDGKQAPECMPGQQYCYPDPAKQPKTELSVAFGDYTHSGNLGEYVNKLISWMLTAGIVIVVVIVMVGGLQYTLSAGSKEMLEKGKKRIKNAVTGMILLLCSYVILNSVNPNLLRMQVPQYPMVKRVELIDNATCESLEENYNITTKEGGAIADGSKKCGTTAMIKSKKDGSDVTGATTCDYVKCDDPNERCVRKSATESVCARCNQIYSGSDKGAAASSGICNSLQLKDAKTNVGSETIVTTANLCFYTHDPHIILSKTEAAVLLAKAGVSGAITGGIGAAVALLGSDVGKKLVSGACAEANINCSNIKTCRDYDDQAKAYSAGLPGEQYEMQSFYTADFWGDNNLKKLCATNPCNVKPLSDDKKSYLSGIPQANVCTLDTIKIVENDCIQRTTGQVSAAEQPTNIGTCDDSACTKTGGKCVKDVNGNKACAKCEQVINGNKLGGGGILPTDQMCQELDGSSVGSNGSPDYIAHRCLSTTDSNMLANLGKGNKTCAMFNIDCKKAWSWINSNNGSDHCRAYDQMTVSNDKNSNEALDNVSDRFYGICPEDPCGVNNPKGCKKNLTGNDCISK